MNLAAIAAVAAIINPAFVGNWCADVKGVDTNVFSITSTQLIVHQGRYDVTCSLSKAQRVLTPADVQKSETEDGPTYIYSTPKILFVDYLFCKDPTPPSPYTGNQDQRNYWTLVDKNTLQGWYVDRDLKKTLDKRYYRCEMNNVED